MRRSSTCVLVVCAVLIGCGHAQSTLPQPAGNVRSGQRSDQLSPTSLPKNYKLLYSFQGGTDGVEPNGVLIKDRAGNLYGTTAFGGGSSACSGGCGTVFKLDTSGVETVIHRFDGSDGQEPDAGLIRDSAGDLFGTTRFGGTGDNGVVFKVDPSGIVSVIHYFQNNPDGSAPEARLVRDSTGNLYGTTTLGGVGGGVVFKLDPSGNETILHAFTGSPDGYQPAGDLVFGYARLLYGTTSQGGARRRGTTFEVDPFGGGEKILHSFLGRDGRDPDGGLVRDSTFNLFGSTQLGGSASEGVVYKSDINGNVTVLRNFNANDGKGNPPTGDLIRNAGGDTYGVAEGGTTVYGLVFELDSSGNETVLHQFTGADGGFPGAGLLRDGSGDLFGVTNAGGASNLGVVFELTH